MSVIVCVLFIETSIEVHEVFVCYNYIRYIVFEKNYFLEKIRIYVF